ncbi:MAG: HIT family protein [Acetivibrio ethanolgignens]
MKKEDCIFCKIAAGEIPSKTLYEDESFRVILDISPASKGHAIILLKNHAANLYELSDEDASKILVVAKKVATVMQDILHCDGLNVLQNNGEAAGQSVFHLHVHLIPRYENDAVSIKWAPGTPDDAFLAEFADKVSTALGQSRA